MARKNSKNELEHAWVLLGQAKGIVLYARRSNRSVGGPASVEFDPYWVLEREETKGDVVGFYHTHPCYKAQPSKRDIDTMRAWVSAFGKPLLCAIEGVDGLKGYRFDAERTDGELIDSTERFSRGVVVGIDSNGW